MIRIPAVERLTYHVAPDGRTAKARWRTLSQTGQFEQRASWGEGPYEIEYVKDNGVWKIQKLHWYITFVTPYEDGWVRVKPMEARAAAFVKDFPPDRPPSESYKPFPAAYLPPYHYENPVTGPSRAAAAVTVSDPTLANWDREVARLEAHDAVENLQGIYGYYFDKSQWDPIADLFTDDATYEVA